MSVEREHAVKWLTNAAEYFKREQQHALTQWGAEQHWEREKACRYALDKIKKAKPE